jgi:hypothetical protein
MRVDDPKPTDDRRAEHLHVTGEHDEIRLGSSDLLCHGRVEGEPVGLLGELHHPGRDALPLSPGLGERVRTVSADRDDLAREVGGVARVEDRLQRAAGSRRQHYEAGGHGASLAVRPKLSRAA